MSKPKCLLVVASEFHVQGSPASAMAVAGVVGGVFAASASHPFDTIKTRMQAHMYSRPEYMTWTSTAATIYQEGGVLNFWRGLLPRMTRIIGERVCYTKFLKLPGAGDCHPQDVIYKILKVSESLSQ